MSAEQHARLSASGAHRWLHCTPSAALEATLPDSTSEYAAEGTLAHAIAELRLRKQYTEPMGPQKFKKALDKLKADKLYQSEMDGHIGTYYDYIASVTHSFPAAPWVGVEKRLDFGDWVPDGFGTGDCLIIGGDVMHVVDLKYGKGVPVSAENNPQMMLYGLGAWAAYSLLYNIQRVVLTIVQPRLDSISTWEISINELLAWGDSIKPIAQQAHAGAGEYSPGDHCRFCRAKTTCRARAEHYLALDYQYQQTKPALLSNVEIGSILPRAEGLDTWYGELKTFALDEVLAGRDIPGYKAVEGRRVRVITDFDAAIGTLAVAGYDRELFYKRVAVAMGEIEKTLGKAKFAELLAPYIVTPPGKPTLVPVTDKRDPYTRSTVETDYPPQP